MKEKVTKFVCLAMFAVLAFATIPACAQPSPLLEETQPGLKLLFTDSTLPNDGWGVINWSTGQYAVENGYWHNTSPAEDTIFRYRTAKKFSPVEEPMSTDMDWVAQVLWKTDGLLYSPGTRVFELVALEVGDANDISVPIARIIREDKVNYSLFAGDGAGNAARIGDPFVMLNTWQTLTFHYESATQTMDFWVSNPDGGDTLIASDLVAIKGNYALRGIQLRASSMYSTDYFDKVILGTYADPSNPKTCEQAIALGYGPASDILMDCYVDSLDVTALVEEWLDCVDPTDAGCQEPWQ